MIKAKKTLGQNFLKDKNILKKIIDAVSISKDDTVLEIGPGEGDLTGLILEQGVRVIAIEKDDRLIKYLTDKFSKEIESGQFTLINNDILEIFDRVVNELDEKKYKIIANIPYYITGILFRKIFESVSLPTEIVFLVQKEVAERITSQKESILSISIKAYGDPKYISTVKAGSFNPAPSVDSAILSIKNISRSKFIENQISEKNFFNIVKAGFSHKRKMLIGNLKESLIFNKSDLTQKNITDILLKTMTELGLNLNSRAEDISVENWIKITKLLSTEKQSIFD